MAAPVRRKRRSRRPDVGRFRTVPIKPDEINYKNVQLLQRLTSTQGKLFSRKRTGLNAQLQRKLAAELKLARFIGLMPYVS